MKKMENITACITGAVHVIRGGRMTEYKCGSAKKCMFGDMCKPLYDIGGCSHYKEYKPPTNEGFLRTATTEQLAKVLLSFCQYPCEICKIQCDDGGKCTYDIALNTIVEWLKQPHTEKE